MFRHIGSAAMFAIICATQASAQDTTRTPSFGIGVSLSPLSFAGDVESFPLVFGQPTILVPIRAGTAVFEPEIAVQRSKSVDRSGGFSREQRVNTWRVGVGLLMETGAREQLHPYIGARFGLQRGTIEFSGFGGNVERDIKGSFMAAVAGAQHYLSPHFSLGGEAQLLRSSATLGDLSAGSETDATTVTTQGVVTIRWYF